LEGCAKKEACNFGLASLDFLLKIIIRVAQKSETERYYLFAGMGGRAARRKHKIILQWAIATGLLASGIVAGLLYVLAR
jgi:hypothetical protein